jgi:hypothetical protein
VGHDVAGSLVDEELQATLSATDEVSFLFCGSGDARHVFSTLNQLANAEGFPIKQRQMFKKAHFTLIDLSASAVARTALFLDLLFQFLMMKGERINGHQDALILMGYLYSCQILPPWVMEKLGANLDMLIKGLEADDDMVLPALYIPHNIRPQVIEKLKGWKKPLTGAYATKAVRLSIRQSLRQEAAQTPHGRLLVAEGYEEEDQIFDNLTVLLPSEKLAQEREPALLPLMAAYKKNRKANRAALNAYIDEHWQTNPTLIDMDFERKVRTVKKPIPDEPPKDLSPAERRMWPMFKQQMKQAQENQLWPPDINYRPLHVLESLPLTTTTSAKGKKKKTISSGGALDVFAMFFEMLALALARIADRLTIELSVGEMAESMERIRYDDGIRSKKGFPQRFDRIHMSNVP